MAESTTLNLIKTYWASIVLLLFVGSLLRNKYKSDLSGIPGPPVAAYTKLRRLYDVWNGQAHWSVNPGFSFNIRSGTSGYGAKDTHSTKT